MLPHRFAWGIRYTLLRAFIVFSWNFLLMKQRNLLFLLPIAFSVCSCNRYYYKPNGVNTPLFTGAGQAHLNLAGSPGWGTATTSYNDNGNNTKENTYFFDVQASVSPLNHLALIGNYSTYAYRTSSQDTAIGRVNASSHLLEGGIGGYYATKGRRKVQLVTDLFVGYGGGPIRSDVDMTGTRWFIQPGIGMHSPWVDVAYNLRVSTVSYSHFNANGRTMAYLLDNHLEDTLGNGIESKSYTFLEPSFTLRAGYKFAKVQLQMVLAQSANYIPWNYNGVRFTVGFYFSLEDALAFHNQPGKAAR